MRNIIICFIQAEVGLISETEIYLQPSLPESHHSIELMKQRWVWDV